MLKVDLVPREPRPALAARDTRMFTEAASSGEVLRRQFARNHEALQRLGATLRDRSPQLVATCARGSSDHAATFAKYLIETRLGLPTTSSAMSVNTVYGSQTAMRGGVCLAISQSGRSPDLLSSVQNASRAGALTVALVNVEDSPLAALADVVVPLCAGPETSVAATKSFIASMAAIVHLVAAWTGDDSLLDALKAAPDALERAWDADWSAGAAALREVGNLYVIGRGLGLGVAQEAALKFKETCSLHAEAFSSAEVRHGPMALVGEGFPVLVMSQDDETRAGVDQLAAEFAERGARLIMAGASLPGALNLPAVDAPLEIEPLVLIQSFYRMAAELSVLRGLDPDRPPHLNKVTHTL